MQYDQVHRTATQVSQAHQPEHATYDARFPNAASCWLQRHGVFARAAGTLLEWQHQSACTRRVYNTVLAFMGAAKVDHRCLAVRGLVPLLSMAYRVPVPGRVLFGELTLSLCLLCLELDVSRQLFRPLRSRRPRTKPSMHQDSLQPGDAHIQRIRKDQDL